MNNHPYSYDDLLDYLVGDLDAEKHAQLAHHLSSCLACSQTVNRFNKIRTLMRQDDSLDPPPRTLERAKALFAPQRHPVFQPLQSRARLRAVLSFAGGFAAAIILLFGLGAFIANQDIPPDSVLYPVKVSVQGLQTVISNVGQRLGVNTTPTSTTPAPAAPTFTITKPPPSDIVISQVYGGGGNTGATFTHDFIELFNRGSQPVSLAGWSLQYASASGSSNFGATPTLITELPDLTLDPGQYLLVQQARGSGGTRPLPTPDVIDPTPIALSATGGKVALVNTTTPLGCNGGTVPCLASARAFIVDLVSYGKADFFQGLGPGPETTNATAVLRVNDGCKDTKNNMDDLVAGAPNPRNRMTPPASCSPTTPKPQSGNQKENPLPVGQEKTPPGQDKVPPGQEKTPPGQDRTPPGQEKNPPGQGKTPPGQDETPPGQGKPPPGQEKTTSDQPPIPTVSQTPQPSQDTTSTSSTQDKPVTKNQPPGQEQPSGQPQPPGQDKTPPGQDQDRNPPGQEKGQPNQK